jgi:multiple sugar transport system permease protein
MEATTVTAARPRPRRGRSRRPRGSAPRWIWSIVAVIVVYCLAPFYWLVNVSLRSQLDQSSARIVPPHPTLSNFRAIFENSQFTHALLNSAVVATATTALSLVVGSFCAYALARLRFKGKFWLLATVLSITTFPQIVIAEPLYRLWSDPPSGLPALYDTLPGLILPYLTFALPLTIYILTTFFKEIPRELEEAALVDGASRFQAFRKIAVPLAAPGMATAAILTFIAAWNEFLLALTLTDSTRARTVPVAIAYFTTQGASAQYEVPYGALAAASLVISIPLVVLVLVFQRRIVRGLTAGAVKG